MNGSARPWRVHPGALGPGAIEVPGDKSITHRAVLLAALARGESRIENPNPGADCEASLAAAAALGAGVRREPGAWRITGTGGALREPGAPLDCGNSGTSLRLLAGVVAGAPIRAVLTGDDSLRRRPVDRVVAPLRAMGARLAARDGDRHPPLEIEGGGLRGAAFEEPTASAQVASCVLLAGLAAAGRTSVRTRAGVRDHTVHALRSFGAAVATEVLPDGSTRIAVEGPCALRATRLRVPGDPSAASFFFAIAAATPGLTIEARGVGINPTRLGLLEVLRAMGASVEVVPGPDPGGEPAGDVRVTGAASLRAVEIPGERVPALVDEVPAWAMAAALARGRSRLSGAGELRLKESDRLGALAENLAALGIEARASAEGLEIEGGVPGGGEVRARGDHRIAMAFAMLATRARGPVAVDDAAAVGTSFPGFVSAFRALGGRLEADGSGAP